MDIDFEQHQIKVMGKRNKERYIPLLNSVQEILKNIFKLKTRNFKRQSTFFS